MKKIKGLLIICCLLLSIMNYKLSAASVDTESDGIFQDESKYFNTMLTYDYDYEEKLSIYMDNNYSNAKISSVKIADKVIDKKYITRDEYGDIIILRKAFDKLNAGSYNLEIIFNKKDIYRIQLLLFKTPSKAANKKETKFLGTYYYDAKDHPDYFEIKINAKGYSRYYLMTYYGGLKIIEEFTYDGDTLRIYSNRYNGKISGEFELLGDENIICSFQLIEKSQKHPRAISTIYSTKTVSVGNKYQLFSGASKIKNINNIDFATTDSSIAKVSDKGLITVLKEGKVYISAFVYSNGYWIEHKILLTAQKGSSKGKTYNLTSISMENGIPVVSMSKEINIGKKMQIYTNSYDFKNSINSIKDKKIAVVNKDGYIEGKSKGKTTVTTIVNTEVLNYETGEYVNTKLAKFVFNITVK